MSLAGDLLEQAHHLASRERTRSKQASLRRAVSAAYYAVFHFLIGEASRLLAFPDSVVKVQRREFQHGGMKKISAMFHAGNPPSPGGTKPQSELPEGLAAAAGKFVQLQTARHEADYDLDASFRRVEVIEFVELAAQVVSEWPALRRAHPEWTSFYLFCLFNETPRLK